MTSHFAVTITLFQVQRGKGVKKGLEVAVIPKESPTRKTPIARKKKYRNNLKQPARIFSCVANLLHFLAVKEKKVNWSLPSVVPLSKFNHLATKLTTFNASRNLYVASITSPTKIEM